MNVYDVKGKCESKAFRCEADSDSLRELCRIASMSVKLTRQICVLA
jgi:hypothetical protein